MAHSSTCIAPFWRPKAMSADARGAHRHRSRKPTPAERQFQARSRRVNAIAAWVMRHSPTPHRGRCTGRIPTAPRPRVAQCPPEPGAGTRPDSRNSMPHLRMPRGRIPPPGSPGTFGHSPRGAGLRRAQVRGKDAGRRIQFLGPLAGTEIHDAHHRDEAEDGDADERLDHGESGTLHSQWIRIHTAADGASHAATTAPAASMGPNGICWPRRNAPANNPSNATDPLRR